MLWKRDRFLYNTQREERVSLYSIYSKPILSVLKDIKLQNTQNSNCRWIPARWMWSPLVTMSGGYKEMSVCLGWPKAALYSCVQWVRLFTGAQINFGDPPSYLTYATCILLLAVFCIRLRKVRSDLAIQGKGVDSYWNADPDLGPMKITRK
jgi:hypothetical protein